MDITEIKNINGKTDFIAFLGGLAEDFRDRPEEWQCQTIDEFLEACAAWIMSPPKDSGIDWSKLDYKSAAKIFIKGKSCE